MPNELWERIESPLPKREQRIRYPGRKPVADRQVLCGISFMLHTGIQWPGPGRGTCRPHPGPVLRHRGSQLAIRRAAVMHRGAASPPPHCVGRCTAASAGSRRLEPGRRPDESAGRSIRSRRLTAWTSSALRTATGPALPSRRKDEEVTPRRCGACRGSGSI
ncbi:transposase [Streptomyces sp. NPDC056638]|uniref:transposase n=1 Tax=Streptomyces sp. NPDC056638 TaxID=3345887 RepID=UPI00367C7092